MRHIIFDIETAGLRDEALALAEPFKPFEPLPPFDPKAVKVGNLKDPDKIAAKIQAEEDSYPARCKEHEAAYEIGKMEYEAKIISRAALNALSGRVVAIGVMEDGKAKILEAKTEAELLQAFWAYFGTTDKKFVGWNINGFDVPFLVRRSWALGVIVPNVFNGRYLSTRFIDLMEVFGCGEYGYRVSLDNAAKFLGVPGKFEGNVEGASFAEHFEGADPIMRKQAEEYLLCDLRATWAIAERLLNMPTPAQPTKEEGAEFC